MRPILVLALSGALFACRTSSLGSCSSDGDCSQATAMCDLSQHVCVQTDAPQIAGVTVTTPAAYTDPGGKPYFDTAGADLAVSATVTSRAGSAVDPASVCLRLVSESGPCTHAGTAGAANTFTFALPRLPGPADGTALGFLISAASASGHTALSPTQQIYFDDQPPSVSIVDDPKAYARTLPDGGAAMIDVTASIADSTGVVSPRLLSGSKSVPPSSVSGGLYVFQLDPRDAPAGSEGAYGFQIAADDNLGHSALSGGSRKIDDKAPTVSLQIYKDAPDGSVVAYPAAVANTGWTGATFVYSDRVHVTGTITDLSGVGSATLRVDGIEIDGGVAAGAPRPLGCAPGSTSCPFSVAVTLNDAGVPFHTGVSTFDAGTAVGQIPAGNLQFTIDAQDTAAGSDGTLSPKAGSSGAAARTTRLLWHATLSGTAVSGLAVHPDGDLIVTMDGGTAETVYSLAPDQPVTHWGAILDVTNASDGVNGTPAIGAGGPSSARIYLAASVGDFYALNPDGGPAWVFQIPTTTPFYVGPAVTELDGGVEEIIVPDGVGGGASQVWGGTSALDVTSVASNNRDFHSAPLILNGNVFFGTQNAGGTTTHVTKHSIAFADGALGAATASAVNGGAPYFGLVTDGTSLFAATRPASGAGILVGLDPSFNQLASWVTPTLSPGLAGEPTFGIDGKLYGADLGGLNSADVWTFDPATGSKTNLFTLAGGGTPGLTPLQGSDGHIYLPRRTSALQAYEGNRLSWTFTAPAAILRQAMMDCAGRVFVGAGASVYAFISDDQGLADTPWPSLRRDARNTGNASPPLGPLRYGIRTTTGCNQ